MSWFQATAEQFGKTPAPEGTIRDDGSGRVFALGGSSASTGIWNPYAPKLDPTTGEYVTPSSSGPLWAPAGETSGGAQDPQAFFNSLFPGSTLTPQQLAAAEQQLAQQGIRLLGPNAAGMRTKIQLPDGRVIDVIGGAGAGHNTKQWGVTGGGAPQPPMGTATGSLSSIAGGPNYAARLPALEKTPGFQFRMNQGMDAVQKSAAAKGTLLSGGTLKDLTEFAQGLASTEFDNEFGRNMSLAQLGFNAATNQGQYGTAYGNQLTDLTTGAGNARAAGTVGAGNAWSNGLTNIGQMATDLYGLSRYPQYPRY